MKTTLSFCVGLFVALTANVLADNAAPSKSIAEDDIATLRQGFAISLENTKPAALQQASNNDIKRKRAYPMQPPAIPHTIDGYQIDKHANQCLSCHARNRVEDTQAPMISVTHFMDRDGNFLADVSPRRYFCDQCHVTQVERKPLVKNTFTDVNQMLIKQPPSH